MRALCLLSVAVTWIACQSPIEVGRVGKLALCDAAGSACAGPDGLELAFDDAAVGGRAGRTLELRNTGSAPLTVTGLSSDAVDFSPGATTLTVPAGGRSTFDVTFTPRESGERLATLTVTTDIPGAAPVLVKLKGRGLAPKLCVEPGNALVFPDSKPGETTSRALTLRSCGELPLTVQVALGTGSTGFVLPGAPLAPLNLSPGELASIEVRFHGSEAGTFSGTLELHTNAPLAPLAFVTLSGKATQRPCLLSAGPGLDFGTVAPGQRASRTLTLTNAGEGACRVQAPRLDDAAALAGFQWVGAPAAPFALAPQENRTLELVYAPVDLLGPDTGAAWFDSDSSGGPLSVALSGTPRAPNGCSLSVMTAPDGEGRLLDFDTAPVGSLTKMVATLINVGTGPCAISSVTLGPKVDGNAFGLETSPALPFTLDNAETSSVRISVKFAPGLVGSWLPADNWFQVATDEGGPSECAGGQAGCKRVSFAAQATAVAQASFAPLSVDLGAAQVNNCSTRTKTLLFFNTTSAALVLTAASVSPADFTLVSPPTFPLTLAAHASVPFTVRFQPTALGARNGSLTVTQSGGASSAAALKGLGVATAAVADTFTQGNAGLADVLFVVDNSCSMNEEQTALAAAGPAFMNAVQARGGDYALAVTTTDVADTASSEGGRFVPLTGAGPRIITPSTPNRAALFAQSIQQGTLGSGWEAVFEGARRALSPPLSYGHNTGFLRPQAKLAVVYLSDEPEQSPVTPADHAKHLWALKGFSGASERVRVYPIVPKVGGACTSTTDVARYEALTQLVGGAVHDICTANWNQLAAQIADDLVLLPRQFYLSRPRAPGQALTVKVNGVTRTEGTHYTYDAGPNAITFLAGFIPTPGQVIQVTFSAQCTP